MLERGKLTRINAVPVGEEELKSRGVRYDRRLGEAGYDGLLQAS